jgi:polysaccharide export outer membrane protein
MAWTAAVAQQLRPGDTIAISVYQDPKLDRQVVIGPTGIFTYPLAGQINTSGLTPQQLENTLRAKLRDKYTGSLDITVAVVTTAKTTDEDRPRFFVTGEVSKPGPYPLRDGTTVVQALAMSGGLGQFAARKRIQIRRKAAGSETTMLFDYSAYETGTNLSGDICFWLAHVRACRSRERLRQTGAPRRASVKALRSMTIVGCCRSRRARHTTSPPGSCLD